MKENKDEGMTLAIRPKPLRSAGLASFAVLAYFLLLMILVLWNLPALSHTNPLSYDALGLIFIFAFLVTLLTVLTLFALAAILLWERSRWGAPFGSQKAH